MTSVPSNCSRPIFDSASMSLRKFQKYVCGVVALREAVLSRPPPSTVQLCSESRSPEPRPSLKLKPKVRVHFLIDSLDDRMCFCVRGFVQVGCSKIRTAIAGLPGGTRKELCLPICTQVSISFNAEYSERLSPFLLRRVSGPVLSVCLAEVD